jgi:molybdopterin-guanine dinucleotide biosynthesis protein A
LIDEMDTSCSGVILCGGLSSRFEGANKALLSIAGRRILDRIYRVFEGLFDEILLVCNRPLQFLEWDATIVTDLFDVRSSLTGIHAGLFYARHPYAFFTACDTPFLKREIVELIVSGIEPHVDIVMPDTAAGREPLCAVYSKRCLKPAEAALKRDRLKIQRVFRRLRTRTISEKALRAVDPELTSFFNVNTPRDLEGAEMIASRAQSRQGPGPSERPCFSRSKL